MKSKTTKRLRSIKVAAPGRYSRARLRRALDALHVIEAPKSGGWAVRTLGESGVTKLFATKERALAHALAIHGGVEVVVHDRTAKKPTVLRKPRKKAAEGRDEAAAS